MARSNKTYDIVLCHAPSDDFIVAALARRLRRRGLRPWFERWSAVPPAQSGVRVEFDLSASRMVASVLGPSCPPYWVGESECAVARLGLGATIIILVPGFPHSPSSLPSHLGSYVVDLHDGLDNDNALDQLAALIALSGLEAESTRNSRHGLGPRTLKRNTIRSYNAIAEKFASQWFEHPPVLALEKLLRRLPRRAAVLDAGCGPGHHAKLIAKSGHEIIGVDLSARMLEIARKSVRSVRFEKMDMQCLTFPRHTFDAIWCAGAALHIPREEMIQLLSGYRRVMRPGSILGINLQVGRQSEVINFGEDRRFFEYYRDSSEIAELLSLSGFSVEARDYGETTRNTHEVDIKLRWATLYARPNGEPSRAHGYAGVLPSQEFKLAGDLPTGGMGNE